MMKLANHSTAMILLGFLFLAILLNLMALGLGAMSSFALMNRGAATPSTSVWRALWYLCGAYLTPLRWLGGYGPLTILVASIVESLLASVVVAGFGFGLRMSRNEDAKPL
jgi:hypothetical protein